MRLTQVLVLGTAMLAGCKEGKMVPIKASTAAQTSAAQTLAAQNSKAEQNQALPGGASGRFVGFDRNDYPGDDRLAELRKSFSFAGYWLTPPPGATANTWVGKRDVLRAAGFGFLVLANGRLEQQIVKAGGTPDALGKADAAGAIAAAGREGFPKGTILFLDQEEGGRLTDAQAAYFFGWTEAVAASAYKPGAYLSGQQVPDGTTADGSIAYTTTAADVRERIAEARKHAARLHDVALWVYEDTCPPAPGCVIGGAASVEASGTAGAVAWQYAQSPRRPAVTKSCAQTYGADGMCYGGATKDIFVDLDTAISEDPSHGR